MNRKTRYQGAIVQNDRILLLHTHRCSTGEHYWLLPGGGLKEGESEMECVRREVLEETYLEVHVVQLLLDEPTHLVEPYTRKKTYLCIPVGGEASPGYEPEEEGGGDFEITEVRWFDLRDDTGWDAEMRADPITYQAVQGVRQALGYLPGGPPKETGD
jgi:8-oxo-dGTP pyrophosphatase MutT (NUDIX family)